MSVSSPVADAAAGDLRAYPLCVDFDGTLLRTDAVWECLFAALRRAPIKAVGAILTLIFRGRASFKQVLARTALLDVRLLPYDEAVLAWIRSERAAGRTVWLATAADERIAQAVADHLDVFDGVLCSRDGVNLKSAAKARALTEQFGEKGFIYLADSPSTDGPVWDRAAAAAVAASPKRIAAVEGRYRVVATFPRTAVGLSVWTKALRVHQWAKNVLVFVPLIAAHAWFNVGALAAATLAFASFCAIASATYIVNDLLDMQADRAHPRKRLRPFASGTLQPWQGIALGGSATLGGLACAMLLPFTFLAWLALYVVVTLAYSMWLKSRPVLDVVCLACLYVLRVVAGGAAVGIEVSFWLLLFSLFLFFSLALGKRYTELRGMSVDADEVLAGRGYGRSDLEIVSQLGASSAVASVLVLGLYVNAPATAAIYARPHALFAVCAVLLYWLARFWIRAHRGAMHDDPVVYALRDRASLACLALCAGAVLIAG